MLSLPRYLSDVVGQYHEYPMSVTPRSKNPPPFSHPPPPPPDKDHVSKASNIFNPYHVCWSKARKRRCKTLPRIRERCVRNGRSFEPDGKRQTRIVTTAWKRILVGEPPPAAYSPLLRLACHLLQSLQEHHPGDLNSRGTLLLLRTPRPCWHRFARLVFGVLSQ